VIAEVTICLQPSSCRISRGTCLSDPGAGFQATNALVKVFIPRSLRLDALIMHRYAISPNGATGIASLSPN
jgi:hypothetical protein